ncbi:TIGR02444 family protein [Natronospirillum operosum]|uniref:TIGR02444 family protein n=1 Tax=Natronospirillum operosum TaxID=2759953 RepID=A0A4Z0WCB6_9GAMM|nr:TIGR02444 family protein [Natronospirillum operosum]
MGELNHLTVKHLSPDLPLAFELWQFAGRLYARPGVAEHLLHCQDQHGVWINDWLFAAWQAAKGNTLISAYRDRVHPRQQWRDEVIRPWRTWRRQLKSMQAAGSSGSHYQRVKAAELTLEWHDLAWLARHQDQLTASSGAESAQTQLTISIQRASDWSAGDAAAAALWLSSSADRLSAPGGGSSSDTSAD